MKTLLLALVAAGTLAGCAHQQPPQPLPTEMTSKDMRVSPPNQAPAATLVPPESTTDGRSELAGALSRSNVYFEYDSSLLDENAQQSLQNVAQVMKRHPQLKVQVAGHCDERGTDEYNLVLGQRRAETAKRYLTDLGVRGGQLDTISYGAERPADPAHSPDAWSKNRRDELSVAD